MHRCRFPGLTLVELLIAVAAIGVLALVLLARFGLHGPAAVRSAAKTQASAPQSRTDSQRAAARDLARLGERYRRERDWARARAAGDKSLSLYRALGDQRETAAELRSLGRIAMGSGDFAEAGRRLNESLALYRRQDDRPSTAQALTTLGTLAERQQRPARAEALYTESLSLYRAVGDRGMTATLLHFLGATALSQGRLKAARAFYSQSLSIRRALGDQRGIARSLAGLALVEKRQSGAALAGARPAAIRPQGRPVPLPGP